MEMILIPMIGMNEPVFTDKLRIVSKFWPDLSFNSIINVWSKLYLFPFLIANKERKKIRFLYAQFIRYATQLLLRHFGGLRWLRSITYWPPEEHFHVNAEKILFCPQIDEKIISPLLSRNNYHGEWGSLTISIISK